MNLQAQDKNSVSETVRSGDKKKMKVLCVDDDPDVANAMNRKLPSPRSRCGSRISRHAGVLVSVYRNAGRDCD